MSQSEVCILVQDGERREETVQEALEKRSHGIHEDWRCIDITCDGAVSPHEKGGNQSAHFEHRRWNKKCRFRDRSLEEWRLAWEVLQRSGMSKEEAHAKVKELNEKAKARPYATSFRALSKRAQAVHMDRKEFLKRFGDDLGGLIQEIESRE